MAGQRPVEVITPLNALKAKTASGPNMAAVERADATLRALSYEFDLWLESEVTFLERARDIASSEGLTGTARETLHRHARDLRGLGGTYGYPAVSRLAWLLSELLDCGAATGDAAMALASAHVDAICAAVRDDVQDGRHPVTQALIMDLERQVKDMCAV